MKTVAALSSMAMAAPFLGIVSQPAQAGTLILEGSDAVGRHCQKGDVAACAYRDELWSAIGGADPRNIAVIGDVAGIGSGTHPVSDFSDVATAAAAGGVAGLDDYVALYFTASAGCCYENDTMIGSPADAAAVLAYYNAGGTVVVENYIGGAAWDFIVGSGGTANTHVAGVDGGDPNTTNSCSDGETVTADGILNGFVQPPAIECWTHQSYDQSFFGPLGFTHSFFDGPPDMTNNMTGYSSLLSNGVTVSNPEAAPEPGTLSVVGLGLVGLAATRRRSYRSDGQ